MAIFLLMCNCKNTFRLQKLRPYIFNYQHVYANCSLEPRAFFHMVQIIHQTYYNKTLWLMTLLALASRQSNHLETFLFIKFPLLKRFHCWIIFTRDNVWAIIKQNDKRWWLWGRWWTNLTSMGQRERKKSFEFLKNSHFERVYGWCK